MVKEKDEDDALEYTEGIDLDKDDTPTKEEDDDDKGIRKEPEEVRLEHGDEEWDKMRKGKEDEDEDEDKDEEKDKEKDEEVDDDKKEEKKELTEDEKIKEDVINYLEKSEGGTKYIIKGVEHDLKDLSPQEFRDRFSKAGRFYERAEEQAGREKNLIKRERLVEEGALKSQEILRKYGKESAAKGEDLPEALKPDEDDTDSEKTLKEISANLYRRVNKLEGDTKHQRNVSDEQQLIRSLDSLQKEFPMMSKEQVVAVNALYDDVDVRMVAENSHNERVSDDYLDTVFKFRPEKLREIEEKAVEKHLKGNPNVRKISRRKSSSTASKKISTKKKFAPRTLDEIEAHIEKKGGWDSIYTEADED